MDMFYKKLLAATTALTVAMAGSAMAANSTQNMEDGAYVTLSGKVVAITDEDEFQLIHNGQKILVDTNDEWPDLFDKSAQQILKTGDMITVSGVVDDNLFGKNEIDAKAIRYDGTTYTRMYVVESYPMANYNPASGMRDDEYMSLTGTISNITEDDKFMLNYGTGTIEVETDGIDLEESNRLSVGDRVTVEGELDKNWFSARELEADTIYVISEYRRR